MAGSASAAAGRASSAAAAWSDHARTDLLCRGEPVDRGAPVRHRTGGSAASVREMNRCAVIAVSTRPGRRASSVASPAAQATTVSAPRYSRMPHAGGRCRARAERASASGRMPPTLSAGVGGARIGPVGAAQHHAVAAPLQREQVHRRRADEAGSETGRRTRVDFGRRRVLLDMPVAQQHDLVGHAHGLGLVVRHVEHGDAEPPLQRQNLAPHVGAKLCVQVRQRFVHQADRRLGDDRAAQCDTLLLAAGELARLAFEQMADAKDLHARGPAGVPARPPERAAPSARTRCSRRRSDAGNSA